MILVSTKYYNIDATGGRNSSGQFSGRNTASSGQCTVVKLLAD